MVYKKEVYSEKLTTDELQTAIAQEPTYRPAVQGRHPSEEHEAAAGGKCSGGHRKHRL